MKKIHITLIILSTLFYFGCEEKNISCTDLTKKEVYHDIVKGTITLYYDEDELFTGKCMTWGSLVGYEDMETSIKDGYRWGVQKCWYSYSQNKLKFERNFGKGILHGDFIEWWENGQIKEKGEYVGGRKKIYDSQCFDVDGNDIMCEELKEEIDKIIKK